MVASSNIGIGIGDIGTDVTYQVGIWHTPDGWVATATMGSGKITGATVGVSLQGAVSSAQSGNELGGKFDQRGVSIGRGPPSDRRFRHRGARRVGGFSRSRRQREVPTN